DPGCLEILGRSTIWKGGVNVCNEETPIPAHRPPRSRSRVGAATAVLDGAAADASSQDSGQSKDALHRYLCSAWCVARMVGAGSGRSGRTEVGAAQQEFQVSDDLGAAGTVSGSQGDSERAVVEVGRASSRTDWRRPLGRGGLFVRQ